MVGRWQSTGAAVNAFLAQPFANYNIGTGYYLSHFAIITSNWLAASGERLDSSRWAAALGRVLGWVINR